MKRLATGWLWLVVFTVYLVSTFSVVHALTIAHDPAADVRTTASTAAINWTTDGNASSEVRYGRSVFTLDANTGNASLVTQHSIFLTGLQRDTAYYYLLNATDAAGSSVIDDNSGSKYVFHTSAFFEPEMANESLFLDADVPTHANTRYLNVIGRTLSGASVRLYVNKPSPTVGGLAYDASTLTTVSGEFAFARVNLPLQQNTIDIVVRKGTQNVTRHFTVAIDTEPPIVNLSLPAVANATSLRVQGMVSEDVGVTIHIGDALDTLDVKNLSIGPFNLTLELQDEAANQVTLEFADAAGNSVSVGREILVSTRPPQIHWTNLASLNPSYVQDVVIKGNVTPGSMIVVFVNNQTTPDASWSTSVIEIVKHFGQILDREFFGLFGDETYSTRAASDGSFELSIKLSQDLDIGGAESFPPVTPAPPQTGPAPAHIPPTTPVAGATIVSRDQFRNTVLLLVISPSGLTSTANGEIIYTKCGVGGDWDIDIGDITPSVVLPEHLRRGIAQFGFNMNLKWQGPGDQGVLHGQPYFTLVPMNREERATYAFDPALLVNQNGIIPVCSSDMKTCHVVMRLNRYNYTQPQLEDITYKKLGVKLPLLVELRYSTQYGGVREERTQRQCVEFNSVLDVQVPPSVIPDALLKGSITAIDAIVDVINTILKPLLIITKITFFVCLFSWVVWFVYLVYKNYTCASDGQTAQSCVDAKLKSNEIDYYMRWVCDRVFCPSAPTYAKFLENPPGSEIGAGGEVNACQGVTKGSPAFYDEEPGDLFTPGARNCAALYKFKWDTACVGMDELDRSRCQQARADHDTGRERKFCGGPLTQAFYAASGICEGSREVEKYRVTRGTTIYEYNRASRTWFECKRTLTVDERTGEQHPELKCEDELTVLQVTNLGLEDQERVRRENIVNPTEGFLTSVQCACLPGVNGYLQLWRNILVQIKQCFQTILVTGQGSSGLCRAVLTQYLCDIIFDAISCFSQLYGGSTTTQTSGRGIPGFMSAMSNAGDEIQQSITGRYGKTALYNTLFSERKLMHSICLFAFTGDWDLDMDQALGGLGVVPLKSEAFVYPATRRYMTSNPLQYGRTTHIYHIGAGLVAGDDINYRLQLVCSNDNSCNPEDSGRVGGECDCFGKPAPQYYDITRELGPGRISAGGIAQGDIYAQVPDWPVRFDKVRLVWNSVRNVTGRGAPAGEKIVEIRQEGGNAPADCTFDLADLEFRCSFDIGERGYAVFQQPPTSIKSVSPTGVLVPGGATVPFGLDEPLRLQMTINKRSPNFDRDASDPEKHNPDNELPFFLRYYVRTPRGIISTGMRDIPSSGQVYLPIQSDGTIEVTDRPGLVIKKEHFLAGGMSAAISPSDMPGMTRLLLVQAAATGTLTATTRFAVKFAATLSAGGGIAYEVYDVDANLNLVGQPIRTGTYTAVGDPIIIPEKMFTITPAASTSPNAVPFDDLKNRGVIVTYTPTAPGVGTSVDNCDLHKSSPEPWTVHVDIVYPAQKVPDLPLSRRNAAPSTEVVVFNGVRQEFDVPVQAICGPYAGSQAGQQCQNNTILSSICQCGSSLVSGMTNYCGDAINHNYCSYPAGGLPFCTEYKQCPTVQTNLANVPAASRVQVRDQCDCDTSTRDMECSSGDFCDQQGGTTTSPVYKCGGVATAAGAAP